MSQGRNGNSGSQAISLPKGSRAIHSIGEKFSPDLLTGYFNIKGIPRYRERDSKLKEHDTFMLSGAEGLVDYLIQLSDASFAAPEPPPKFYLTHYRNYKSTFDDNAPLIRLFADYFKELDFYRMVSHMAAWRTHNLEGDRWEVFSEVWGGKNNTLDKIFDELGFRGITGDEYASILQKLVERSWVQQDREIYQSTADGKRIRDEAEALTDK